MMPKLLFKKAEIYSDTLDKLNTEIMPLSVSKVDDFIKFKKKVEDLNTTIEQYKPPLEFINAL